MRWYIIRTLLHKEALRHVADRGGIVLALLLVAAALLLSFFGNSNTRAGTLTGGVERCYIDYRSDDDPWIQYLRQHVSSLPEALRPSIRFRSERGGQIRRNVDGVIEYPTGCAAIQIYRSGRGPGRRFVVQFWHQGESLGDLGPYEAWFWKEWHNYCEGQVLAAAAGSDPELRAKLQAALPDVVEEHKHIEGGLDIRSLIATVLVLCALFLTCIYLLPSLTCEERERGILLAQALSPASPLEILAAKFLFYPVLGIGLGALLAGLYNPGVLVRPFFWLTLIMAALGSLGVGMTIASLARTQRKASMGSLCYLMAVALFLLICQQNEIPFVPWLVLEYHFPRMLHTVLQYRGPDYQTAVTSWGNLMGLTLLACLWITLATVLFRRRGWQ